MVITIVVVATENVWMSALEQQRSKTLETENMASELDLKDWVAGSGLGRAHLCYGVMIWPNSRKLSQLGELISGAEAERNLAEEYFD